VLWFARYRYSYTLLVFGFTIPPPLEASKTEPLPDDINYDGDVTPLGAIEFTLVLVNTLLLLLIILFS
jgi:hypothetical protein